MLRKLTPILVALLSLLWASTSSAEQPRDWMVGPQPGGTVLNLDVIFPGVQATVEHRIPIYGIANELLFKANSLITLPFYESQADVDLRLLVLSLGGTVGYRNTFRGMQFAPGEDLTRQHRRHRELAGETTNFANAYGEGRATLALPFNDNAVFLSINSLRFEGGPDRVFDWRNGLVRDSGSYFNSISTLYLKERSLGSVGPQVQVINFALDGVRHTQVNYGLVAITRPGFIRKNDIFLLSLLFNFDTSKTGYSAGDVFGAHLFYAPMQFILAYRMVYELSSNSSTDPELEQEAVK